MAKKTVIPAVLSDGSRDKNGEYGAFDVLGSYDRLVTDEQRRLEKRFQAAWKAGVEGRGWEPYNALVSDLKAKAAKDSQVDAAAFQKYLDRLTAIGGHGVRLFAKRARKR